MPVKLPAVHDLAQFIDSPLSEEEKIPITWKEMDLLVSSQSVGMIDNFCNRSDVELLFRVTSGSGSSGSDFHDIIFTVRRDPPIQGTDEFSISFWDRNVCDILEFFLPGGQSIFNGKEHTTSTIGILRPGYGFLFQHFCLFWGEERAPADTEDPRKELADKLT